MNATQVGNLPVELGGVLDEFWKRSPLGLCLVDASGVIVAVNEAFCTAVGRLAVELVGVSALGLIMAEASVQGALAHASFINGDDTAMEGTVYLHKSGRPLFTHVTDTRVRAMDGRVFRLTSLVDLAGQVEGVGPLRNHQRAEIFAAMAADISNDFNNLLSIILGYTAFLQDSTLDAVRLNTAIEGIDNTVRRAANLIRQTLHLSRHDEMASQRIMMGYFVREFYRMSGETLTLGLDVSLDVEEGLPPVLLDPQHFHHALANLGQKARDLAGPGGRMVVSVRQISGESVRTKFPDARENSYVMVVLRTEPSSEKLAEEGTRGVWDQAVRFAERRRDIAVLIVHGIMAGHRGHLEVDARSGPALVFRMYLPVAGEPEPAALPPAVLPPVSAEGLKVLLVDDEETLLRTLQAQLERNGFRIIVARDGLEAVHVFKAHSAEISLVLIDLGLPRMSGWEAFQKIREHAPAVKVIVMSGHLEANLKAKIIRGGACGFLQKPFAVSAALQEVKRACAQRG
ncbi:MAG TPA: response regulator [Rariglobus sp.]|nr:response regulator [Rariglobus sp.]